MVAAKVVSGDDVPKRDDKGETVKPSDMPDPVNPNTHNVTMSDDERAQFDAWLKSRRTDDGATDDENRPSNKEPKRRTDVTALEADLSRLFETHGWSWPDPLDDVDKGGSNR